MTTILWTPGHAEIQGNDEADILAKTAAIEAKELPPEDNVITLQDIKQSAHKSTLIKWQRRWDIGERGRELYEKEPRIKKNILYDHPSKEYFSILTQLRTGYSILNNYKHQTGQTNTTNLCLCGQKETASHFLLECQLYENDREEMMIKLTK